MGNGIFVPSLSVCYSNHYKMVQWKILFPNRKDWSLLCHVLYFHFRNILTCLMKTLQYIVLQVKTKQNKTE